MPILSFKLPEPLRAKMEKKLASLVEDGVIAGIRQKSSNYKISFCLAIQFVPKYSGKQFFFGQPEGIRVFVCVGRKVVAAVDFKFRIKNLRFSHISQGPPLAQLVKVIRKLQAEFSGSKEIGHLELVQFLFIRSQFILVKIGRNRIFYRKGGKKLTKITPGEIRNEIEPILKDPPRFKKH